MPARPVGVDLFCGAGGMSLGFEQAGFDVLAAVDLDPVHLAVHEFNFPFTASLCADLSTVTKAEIEASIRKGWSNFGRDGEWDGTIDCLFGGPSCQGYSYIGAQKADDHRNELVFDFARLVKELRPRTFVIENVPGLLGPVYAPAVKRLLATFSSAGYDLQGGAPFKLDAGNYGVPQDRQRVFIVGALDVETSPKIPTTIPGTTVGDALDDLPEVSEITDLLVTDRLLLNTRELAQLNKAGSAYAKSLREPHGLEYRRTWDAALLSGCQRTDHSPTVEARFARLRPGQEDEPSHTRRLDVAGRSPTLRAGTGRDHGSFTAPRPIHHRASRVITVREAARLHSFPDWFQLHTTRWHGLRQIGNAVPPRLAAAVAREVARSLNFVPNCPELDLPSGEQVLLSLSLREAAERFGLSYDLLPYDVRRKPDHRGKGRASQSA